MENTIKWVIPKFIVCLFYFLLLLIFFLYYFLFVNFSVGDDCLFWHKMGMAENVFAAPTDIDSSPKNEAGSTEQSLFKLLAP